MELHTPELEKFISKERFQVLYRLTGSKDEAAEKAQDIIIEQTVEFPADLVPDGAIRDHIFGKVIDIKEVSENVHEALISYAIETAGGEIPQFLTLIFGNISIKPGIKIIRIGYHPFMEKMCRGPRFGIDGIRKLTDSFDRPLLCGAIKPMGLDALTLAEMAYEFTMGGIDMIKDDHGLADQPFCRFKERVRQVSDAVNDANAKSGSKTLYAPSISGPADEILERAEFAKESGAGALLIAPAITGFDTVRSIAENDRIALPLIAHPAFMGSFTVSPDSGISHYALYGTIMRMVGADGSVYPNFGGRFSFSKEECSDIQKGCTDEFGGFRSIFPMPGGGMSVERVPELKRMYGNDVMFLIGGGLFRRSSDLAGNVKYFRELSR